MRNLIESMINIQTIIMAAIENHRLILVQAVRGTLEMTKRTIIGKKSQKNTRKTPEETETIILYLALKILTGK